jgi:hypothetical protein
LRKRNWRASRMTANDKSLASRASLSGMARGYIGTREIGIRNGEGRGDGPAGPRGGRSPSG